MEEKTVEICRELAMSIWKKTYGKATKAKDFAGREMDKGAYDQRGSKFGWNLDHILPKSQGGKNSESNLICCHIQTNDEKANKYPCFKANDKQFEILKVANHHEIREKIDSSKKTTETKSEVIEDTSTNFYDHSAGIRCYKKYENIFWGTLTIQIKLPTNAAIVDFIKELFEGENVSAVFEQPHLTISVTGIRLPTKESIQLLRDKCLTLNTYLQSYFLRKNIISEYYVFCEAHTQSDELKAISSRNKYSNSKECFVINELVRSNSDAKEKIDSSMCIGRDSLGYKVYRHNWWWTKLKENLEKN